jgi:hypothetical protein
MGRPHQNVAVVTLYNASLKVLGEEIIPLANFRSTGSIYVNSPHVRRAKGIRYISLRLFESEPGIPVGRSTHCYALDGREVPTLHTRPDGSIIEPE